MATAIAVSAAERSSGRGSRRRLAAGEHHQSALAGTIAEAGLVSESENGAEVLVAVTVETSNAGAPEQAPRAWRMRITVEKVGDEAKVSNVGFVP